MAILTPTAAEVAAVPTTPVSKERAGFIIRRDLDGVRRGLERNLKLLDRMIVRAGGLTEIDTTMGAADYAEFRTAYTCIYDTIIALDPTATPPGLDRDRAAEIAAHAARHA